MLRFNRGRESLMPSELASRFLSLACGCRTNVTVCRGRTAEPPYQKHWEIDYRKIIGIYRNFDGKLLHSYFTTASEVFLELIAPLRPFQRCFGS